MMRGRLASRAHSFKENLLNVFGGTVNHQNQSNHHDSSASFNSSNSNTSTTLVEESRKSRGSSAHHDKAVSMSKKKNNSTDNIIEFVTTNSISDPRTIEAMVREVDLALRYFQDAVSKRTYEMLPGCATVVLETVLALQSYAISRNFTRKSSWKSDGFSDDNLGPSSNKITASTNSMCGAVAKLTQWADRVIMDGCVDPTEDYVNQIVDPVRLSVNALASSLISFSKVPRSTSLHNSLPDLASPDQEDHVVHQQQRQPALLLNSNRGNNSSQLEASAGINSKSSGSKGVRPPPLPPKSKSQSQSDESIDPLSSEATTANIDWFSNPLFESNVQRRSNRSKNSRNSKKRASTSRTYSESSVDGSIASKSSELDTTLPDFCKPQRMSVCEQTNVSYIDVSPNLSRESFDFEPVQTGGQGPLATSSPRPNEANYGITRSSEPFPDNTSSSTSSDIPPALPRKIRQPPPLAPPLPLVASNVAASTRKISTYDNLCLPHQNMASGTSFPTFHVYQKSLTSDEIDHEATPIPPPLPPKKKHIMSYMEMFGRSLVTTDEELVQSLTRTKDLLEAVWQQNYHDYSYNSLSTHSYDMASSPGGLVNRPSGNYRQFNDQQHQTSFQFSGLGVRPILKTSHSSYLLPPPELPPPPPPPILSHGSGMPPPFPNLPDDEDVNQGDMDDDDDHSEDIYPPALPPKRGPVMSSNRGFSWTNSTSPVRPHSLPPRPGHQRHQPASAGSGSNEERIIPIMVERPTTNRSGSAGSSRPPPPQRQESTSSAISTAGEGQGPPPQPLENTKNRGNGSHRFSDSMTSSTSSSGLGTDIHSLRHSLPSPVMESSNNSANTAPNTTNISSQSLQVSENTTSGKNINHEMKTRENAPSMKSQSRKGKTKETSPQSVSTSSKAKRSSSKKKKNSGTSSTGCSVLDQMDVRKACLDMLVYTSSTDDQKGNRGKELLRAGSVDALIVLATQSVKNDFLYQEAFMATYRTFIPTNDLLEKLVQRFRKFNNRRDDRAQQQMTYKRVAHCAFSLMVRVVDGLADCDFQDPQVMELLTDFMAELVNDGELTLARALRTKFIQKFEDRKLRLLPDLDTSGLSFSQKPTSLLSFKSVELAEQMTLLDAQLFLRLDSAELILWVQEQNEDKSPNLTKFTEHFNNMSFWCRTKILQQEDPKEREKLVNKFIKIMRELRKHNNFNSYLALLSALDSAPIRRLEWCKSITEALKEHCALIDSSSSFRAYRQALSSAAPPCIPYVGLVLQDLTFVHIGNPDTFDGKVNFAKRWQQFNILDNLMRFKKKTYPFERKEEIIKFFGDFVDYWSEDQMWTVSETIKPRGRRKDAGR